MAGRKIDRTGWRSTQTMTSPSKRAGTWWPSASWLPFRPMLQVVYPPRILPAMAQGVRSHGSPPCATSQISSMSALPGSERGMTEESTNATVKSPRGPRCASQCGTIGAFGLGEGSCIGCRTVASITGWPISALKTTRTSSNTSRYSPNLLARIRKLSGSPVV